MKVHELNRLNMSLSKELKQEAITNFKLKNLIACLSVVLFVNILIVLIWFVLFIFFRDFARNIYIPYFRYSGFFTYFVFLPLYVLYVLKKYYFGTYRVLEVNITEKEKRGILNNKNTSYWIKGHNKTWVKVRDALFWEKELSVGNRYFLLLLDDEVESVNLNPYFWGYMQSD